MRVTRLVVLSGLGAVVVAVVAVATASLQTPSTPRASVPEPTLDDRVARFDGGTWAFDYPAAWSVYGLDRTGFEIAPIGLITSQPMDIETACVEAAGPPDCDPDRIELEAGNVLIQMTLWTRTIDDPLTNWLTPSRGRATKVGGMPAVTGDRSTDSSRSLWWQIADPSEVDRFIQIEVEIARPDSTDAVGQIHSMIASFAYRPPVKAVDKVAPDAVIAPALANVRSIDGNVFGCFPEVAGGSREKIILEVRRHRLLRQLAATCTTVIVPTPINYWRLELTFSWGAGRDRVPGERTFRYWVGADSSVKPIDVVGDPFPYCCAPA